MLMKLVTREKIIPIVVKALSFHASMCRARALRTLLSRLNMLREETFTVMHSCLPTPPVPRLGWAIGWRHKILWLPITAQTHALYLQQSELVVRNLFSIAAFLSHHGCGLYLNLVGVNRSMRNVGYKWRPRE